MRRIVDLLLNRVREQLRAQQIELQVTQDAKDHLVKLGFDADYGARPAKRTIQNLVEDPLAEALLLGRFTAGQTILVDRDPDAGLTIEPLPEMTPVEA
jgi:ATP-dependent Clp protease ATP-binding subunit ClpC